MPFPTTPVLDNFNRANSGDIGANWSANFFGDGAGTFSISSNQCAATAGLTGEYYNVSTYGPDSECYYTVNAGLSDRAYLFARCQGSNLDTALNAYGVRFNASGISGTVRFVRIDSSTVTVLGADISQSLSAGDSVGMTVIGGTITAYYKASGGSWVSLGTRSDSTYTAGGYLAIETNSTTWNIDDFGGGTIGFQPIPYLQQNVPTMFGYSDRPQKWN